MKWRKLWRDDPASTFPQLCITTRAIAARLLIEANEDGGLAPPSNDPALAVCKSIGVPTRQRKLWRRCLNELLADQWLTADETGVRIRNFMRFQHRSTNPKRTELDPGGTELDRGDFSGGGKPSESLAPKRQKRREEIKKRKNNTTSDKPPRVPRLAPGLVDTLFSYWKQELRHPRSKLDDKRKRLLSNALRQYGLEDCKRVVDGAKASAWHMGANEDGRVYDKVSLLFRDSEKMEQFIGWAHKPPEKSRRAPTDSVDVIIRDAERRKEMRRRGEAQAAADRAEQRKAKHGSDI